MIPINNSDTAWLIVADYNQENDKFHEYLREDIIDPITDQWCCLCHYDLLGGGPEGQMVGMNSVVGNDEICITFCMNDFNGASKAVGVIGVLVGGNHYETTRIE